MRRVLELWMLMMPPGSDGVERVPRAGRLYCEGCRCEVRVMIQDVMR